MKVYRAIEERGLSLAFHSGPNWGEPVFKSLNRFLSVHALGFSFYNILHLHQLGDQRHGRALPEAAGDLDRVRPRLGAVPDAAARSRVHAAPVGISAAEEEAVATTCATCTTRRSRWRVQDMGALEMHVPHDQCGDAAPVLLGLSALGLRPADRRSADLPFLSEKAKHNILGGNAARLFKLPPRNEKQKEQPAEVRQSHRRGLIRAKRVLRRAALRAARLHLAGLRPTAASPPRGSVLAGRCHGRSFSSTLDASTEKSRAAPDVLRTRRPGRIAMTKFISTTTACAVALLTATMLAPTARAAENWNFYHAPVGAELSPLRAAPRC